MKNRQIILVVVLCLFIGCSWNINVPNNIRLNYENFFATQKGLMMDITTSAAKAEKKGTIKNEDWLKVSKIHNDYMKIHNEAVELLKFAIKTNDYDEVNKKKLVIIGLINKAVELYIKYGIEEEK